MEENTLGGIGVFNPAKDIAKEVTLNILIRHRDATQQAREGIIQGEEQTSDNQKKMNKVRGLYKMISAQREMINISRPIVRFSCFQAWKKKNENKKDKEDVVPFEKEDNDYNNLMLIKGILEQAELDMVKAEQTESQADDYIVDQIDHRGRTFLLTPKYYEMLNGLEDTYEKIYFMMVKYRIASTGIEEDELKTYKELEEEAIKRVVEA